jgi:hypothetical protein
VSIFQLFHRKKNEALRPVRRSSWTISESLDKAREAGRKTPDTGLFEEWVRVKGLSSRGQVLIARLRREYEAGFEERFAPPTPRELNAAFLRKMEAIPAAALPAYKGFRLWEDAEGFHYSGEKESTFDTLRDVRRFIDSL